jgi:hypothetical protein
VFAGTSKKDVGDDFARPVSSWTRRYAFYRPSHDRSPVAEIRATLTYIHRVRILQELRESNAAPDSRLVATPTPSATSSPSPRWSPRPTPATATAKKATPMCITPPRDASRVSRIPARKFFLLHLHRDRERRPIPFSASVPELGESCSTLDVAFCRTNNTRCKSGVCACLDGFEPVPGRKDCLRLSRTRSSCFRYRSPRQRRKQEIFQEGR